MISEERGFTLANANVQMLGRAEKVTITKENTIIVGGAGEADAIKDRADQIRKQIETTKSDYDREKLQERLGKLAGGVAVIYVGATSEIEMKEKKDRVDDALNATRAAVEEGYLPGGGVAYIRAAEALSNLFLLIVLVILIEAAFLSSMKLGNWLIIFPSSIFSSSSF